MHTSDVFIVTISVGLLCSFLAIFFRREAASVLFTNAYALFTVSILSNRMPVNLNFENRITDTYEIVYVFINSKNLSEFLFGNFGWKLDYFFFFILYIVRQLTDNVHILFFCLHVIGVFATIAGLSKILRANKIDHIWLCVVFFAITMTPDFFALQTNLLRQGVATGLLVLAIGYLFENKLQVALFIFLFSALTHKSVFLLPIIYPLLMIIVRQKNGLLRDLSAIALVIFFTKALIYFVAIFDFPFFTTRLNAYEGIKTIYGIEDVKLLLYLAVSYTSWIVSRDATAPSKNIALLCVMLSIFSVGFSDYPIISNRISFYITIFMPICLILIGLKGNSKLFQHLTFLGVLSIYTMMFFAVTANLSSSFQLIKFD